jgi:hypothetical protein
MPQPQSATASATAAGSHQTLTMIGVPGSLYLQANSSSSSRVPGVGQPTVVERQGAGRLGHQHQRGEGASGEMTPDRRGQRPKA